MLGHNHNISVEEQDFGFQFWNSVLPIWNFSSDTSVLRIVTVVGMERGCVAVALRLDIVFLELGLIIIADSSFCLGN
ncbi:hypothetical protein Hanom_Chr06g00529591 [Helianthus anomalus]